MTVDRTGTRLSDAGLIATLAAFQGVVPLGTDMILPAFPMMRTFFDVPAAAVQLTLTTFLIGLAVGQLAFGPISDRVGRKRPLVAGTVAAAIAAAAAAAAPTIGLLLIARLLQGFMCSAGIVLGRALIADRFSGVQAARSFGMLTAISAVAPVVAPVIGGFLAPVFGFRGILWVLAALIAALIVPATRLPEPVRVVSSTSWTGALQALSRPAFLLPAVVATIAPAIAMAFIASSTFVYQEVLGVSPTVYGVLFAVNAIGVVLSGAASAVFAHSIRPVAFLAIAAALTVPGTLVVAGAAGGVLPVWLIAVGMFVVIAGSGLLQTHATTIALARPLGAGGTASAAIGTGGFLLSATVAPIVSAGGAQNLAPLVWTVATLVGVSMVCVALLAPGLLAARTGSGS